MFHEDISSGAELLDRRRQRHTSVGNVRQMGASDPQDRPTADLTEQLEESRHARSRLERELAGARAVAERQRSANARLTQHLDESRLAIAYLERQLSEVQAAADNNQFDKDYLTRQLEESRQATLTLEQELAGARASAEQARFANAALMQELLESRHSRSKLEQEPSEAFVGGEFDRATFVDSIQQFKEPRSPMPDLEQDPSGVNATAGLDLCTSTTFAKYVEESGCPAEALEQEQRDPNVIVLCGAKATQHSALGTRDYAADTASMLSDLDFLASSEWQTLPAPSESALDASLLQEVDSAAPGSAAYPIAMKALWHNCPDALEAALKRLDYSVLSEAQVRDANFMAQKLEFTRIRQRFVARCGEFQRDRDLAKLQSGVVAAEKQCSKLMAAQPDEMRSQMPGLISKRDTIMLLVRIREIAAKQALRVSRHRGSS